MPSNAGASAARARPLSGVRVLLVEDDQDARELLDAFLRLEGADVATAADASAGFAQMLRFKPTILLSDIGLPGEDGYSLMRRCRGLPSDGSTVPAIAITAFCRPEDKAKSLAAGFNCHLCKPLDLDEVVASIQRLLPKG
jgi:DNA-binding response OmpR family regulator